ncbi:hypothetical protein GCM10029964_040070 [Kibdelosporangium lantanae]
MPRVWLGNVRVLGNLAKLIGGCVLGGALLAGVLAPVSLGLGVTAAEVGDSVAKITPTAISGKLPTVTTVTDKDGNTIATLYDQYRFPVNSDKIAPAMKAALIAIEDRRFYQEHGIDPKAILRAAINNAKGGDEQGGSTITQQLVKNYLINVVDRDDPVAQRKDRADTLARKLHEARSAIDIDQQLTKDEILTDYLNIVEFTGKVYGVEAAARAYFGTTADKLTVAQSAMLAGMVNNPTRYNPYKDPVSTKTRRNTVLDAMVTNQAIDQATADKAKAEELGLVPDGPNVPSSTCMGGPDYAGYLCQYALSYLTSNGFTANQLDNGGYTIKTTLDAGVSQAAKEAVQNNVPTTQPGVANAMVIIRPGNQSHDILALLANRNLGTDLGKGQTTRNLPAEVDDQFGAGSVFKIFTSAAALESGVADLDTPAEPTRAELDAAPPAHAVHGEKRRRRRRPGQPGGRPRLLPERRVREPGDGGRRPQGGGNGVPSRPAQHHGGQRRRQDPRPEQQEPGDQPADVAVLPGQAVVHPRQQPGEPAGAGERLGHHHERRRVLPTEPDPVGHRRLGPERGGQARRL